MFNYLYTEAYSTLRQEIEALAKEIFSDENDYNAAYNLYHAGQLNAINRVLQRMNSVQTVLDEQFDEEIERIQEDKENV